MYMRLYIQTTAKNALFIYKIYSFKQVVVYILNILDELKYHLYR